MASSHSSADSTPEFGRSSGTPPVHSISPLADSPPLSPTRSPVSRARPRTARLPLRRMPVALLRQQAGLGGTSSGLPVSAATGSPTAARGGRPWLAQWHRRKLGHPLPRPSQSAGVTTDRMSNTDSNTRSARVDNASRAAATAGGGEEEGGGAATARAAAWRRYPQRRIASDGGSAQSSAMDSPAMWQTDSAAEEDWEREDSTLLPSSIADEESSFHRHVRDWYYALLRSRRARQSERTLEAAVAAERATMAARLHHDAEVEAAAQRASGHVLSSRSASANSSIAGKDSPHAAHISISTTPASAAPLSRQTSSSAAAAAAAANSSEGNGTPRSSAPTQRVRAPFSGLAGVAGSEEMRLAPSQLSLQWRASLLSPAAEALKASFHEPATPLLEEAAAAASQESAWADTKRANLFANFSRIFVAVSYGDLVGLWTCVLLVLSGNALQVIALNFWIRRFPISDDASGNYTTLAVSSAMFSTFFVAILVVYLLLERPDLTFFRNRHGLLLLLCVGTADFFCSTFSIYAASHTPEILQALFTSTAPIFTAFFQKRLLHDPRHYGNRWIVLSFGCIIVGVLLASSYGVVHAALVSLRVLRKDNTVLADNSNEVDDGVSHVSRVLWSFVFFCSVIPSVLQNVVLTKYMLWFTRDPLFERWFIAQELITQRFIIGGAQPVEEADPRTDASPPGLSCGSATAISPDKTAEQKHRERSPSRDSQGTDFVHGDGYASLTRPAGAPLLRWRTAPSSASSEGAAPAPIAASSSSAPTAASKEGRTLEVIEEDVEATSSTFTLSDGRTRIRVGYTNVVQGEDLVVKLVLLAFETTTQAIEALLILPLDALPWWGGSKSVPAAARNLESGVQCFFNCKDNMKFGFLYCLGFVFMYIGSVYLDQYSVTVCSMITQLAAPCTALLLICIPFLNLTGDVTPWWITVIAVGFLVTGTLVYTAWDQRTAGEKTLHEHVLKKEYTQPRMIVEPETPYRGESKSARPRRMNYGTLESTAN